MTRPPRGPNYDKIRPRKPNGIKDLPRYLREVLSGFFQRLFYIFKLVKDANGWILILMMSYSLIAGVIPVISALISRELINSLTDAVTGKAENFDVILKFLLFQFGFIVLSSLINSLYSMIIRLSGELVTNHIKLTILEKTKEVDMSSFDMPDFYERLENASREAGTRPISILQSVFNIISTIISLVSFIIILAEVSAWAPLAMIAFSLPSAAISFIYRKKNFEYMRMRSKERREMQYYSDLLTDKDVAKEVRIFNLSDTFIDCYKESFGKYFTGIKRLIYAENAWSVGISLAGSAISCGLFLFVARMVWKGLLQVGDYTLYTGALNSISSSVSSLISTLAMIYEGTLFIDNMIAFMNEKQRIKPTTDKPLSVSRGIAHKIEFKNVSFRYPGTNRDVIKNMSFTINDGETAVLVGLNGAGKTTLIKLLTRLYDPTSGEIFLDGRDIRLYDTRELYDMFGIIFQDFGKYAFTAAENIMFGEVKRGLDREGIENAARCADAETFIKRLPKSYDTPLTRIFEDSGIELSIGQWQKLSIARAFYGSSDFLILDEPTASLDAIAEQEIYSEFEELRRGKTTIFVSHRLSSATTATKILVIERGELVEEGTHRELMEMHGKYFELFSTQAKRYVEGAN